MLPFVAFLRQTVTYFAARSCWLSIIVVLLSLVASDVRGEPGREPSSAENAGPSIRFRMGGQAGSGRIVLESERPFAAVQTQDGDDVVFRLGRKLSGDAQRLPVVLSEFVLSATTRGDTLRLRLRRSVRVQPRQAAPERMILEFRQGSPTLPDMEAGRSAPYPALLAEDPVELAERTVRLTPASAAALAAGGPAWTEPATLEPHPSTRTTLPPSAPVNRDGVMSIAVLNDGVPAIRYRWNRDMPAAVFQRDDWLWLVFAGRTTRIEADALGLARSLDGYVLDARREMLPQAVLFRLRLAPHIHARLQSLAGQEGDAWQVEFHHGSTDPADGGTPGLPAVAAAGRSLQVATTEPGLWLSDPAAGDRLLVFPDRAEAVLPRSAASFPDLEFLPSLAGIVVQPLRPDLLVEPARDGMVLRRADGRPLVQAGSALPDRPFEPAPGLDFVRFGSTPLRDARRRAEAELAAHPDDPFRQAMLIRTLLAGNLAEEARIVAALSMRQDATVGALSAVTDALIDPLHADIAPFSEMGPADDKEAALWRSYLLASRGQHAEAMRSHGRSGDRLRHYPSPLRVVLAPTIVGALLDQGRPSAALAVLDGLLAEASEPREIALLKLLQGRALASEEAIGQARAKLAEAATAEDRDVALAAHGDGLDLDLESGIMAPEAANAELAGMALAWEGSTEQRAMELRRARIAAQAGDWQAAVTAAERAASLQADPTPNPSSPLVELLEQALSAPDLSPFERLSLLRNRPIALVQAPSIAGQVASLVHDLTALGASETAQSLADSAEIPRDYVPSPSSESASPSKYENDETTEALLSMAAEPGRLLPNQAAQLSRLLEKLSMN